MPCARGCGPCADSKGRRARLPQRRIKNGTTELFKISCINGGIYGGSRARGSGRRFQPNGGFSGRSNPKDTAKVVWILERKKL